MKVRRYTGASLEKIRDAIVNELGENAVIVSSRKVEHAKSGSLLGLGRKPEPSFEVTAAVDDAIDADSDNPAPPPRAIQELIDSQKEQYRGLRTSMKMLDEKLADVDERIAALSKVGGGAAAASAGAVAAPSMQGLSNVHDAWLEDLASAAKSVAKGREPEPADWHEALASMLKTAGGILFRSTPSSAPDVYALAGPTGVGKTTTLAKLAAKCVLNEKLKVGMISMDTFRVGAVDQLREYASLLGIELAVAFSQQELESQLKRFHDKDVVFIDTPGRGQFDKNGIKGIAECVGSIPGVCTLLVVPAGVRKEDASAIVSGYAGLNPSALVISKTDEASKCDGLTQLLDLSKVPVVFLTDGQRVPEDIHPASPGVLASLVIPAVKSVEQIKIGELANG